MLLSAVKDTDSLSLLCYAPSTAHASLLINLALYDFVKKYKLIRVNPRR